MTRRSMSAALSVADPDVKAFLKEGVPTSKVAPAPVQEPPVEQTPRGSSSQLPVVAEAPAQTEKPKAKAKAQVEIEESDEETVTVTYRIPKRLVSAMISASADRKIRRIKPSSQQHMATIALEEWLKKNAYL